MTSICILEFHVYLCQEIAPGTEKKTESVRLHFVLGLTSMIYVILSKISQGPLVSAKPSGIVIFRQLHAHWLQGHSSSRS